MERKSQFVFEPGHDVERREVERFREGGIGGRGLHDGERPAIERLEPR
jgi:hypothetical protein